MFILTTTYNNREFVFEDGIGFGDIKYYKPRKYTSRSAAENALDKIVLADVRFKNCTYTNTQVKEV